MSNQSPHTDPHDLLRREARDYAAPDRLYPIQSNKNHAFYAGTLPNNRQALVALDVDDSIVIAVFDREGNLLEVQTRVLAGSLKCAPEECYMQVNDSELNEYLREHFGFVPALIHVKAFLIADEISSVRFLNVQPFPHHYQEYLDDPHEKGIFDDLDRQSYPEMIRRWMADRAFVLNWGNDFWLDDNGEVTAS